MKRLLMNKYAEYTSYNNLYDIIDNTSDDEQIENLINIIQIYILSDNIYEYFIQSYKLNTVQEFQTFFNIQYNSDYLLEYLRSIKEQIASKYLVMHQYTVENINKLSKDIIDIISEQSFQLRKLVNLVIMHVNNFISKHMKDNTFDEPIYEAEELGLMNDNEDPINGDHMIVEVDINNRIKPFVDLDHIIVEAEAGEQTHGQVINRYLKLGKSKEKSWFRTDRRVIKEHAKQFAFGHICNNKVIVIDALIDMTMDDVVQDLKAADYSDYKIYYYDNILSEFGLATRKARLMRLFIKK